MLAVVRERRYLLTLTHVADHVVTPEYDVINS